MTYEYQVGEWYKTLGGFEAQVLDVNYKSAGHGQRIVGKIKRDNGEGLITWESDGSFVGEKQPNQYDLLPPVERKERWVNVYKECVGSGSWSSKERAEENADCNYIGLIRIIFEGDDFTVEKVTG